MAERTSVNTQFIFVYILVSFINGQSIVKHNGDYFLKYDNLFAKWYTARDYQPVERGIGLQIKQLAITQQVMEYNSISGER